MSDTVKSFPAPAPFEGYKTYQPSRNPAGRLVAALIPIDPASGLKPTTMAYARYLMSVHLGRRLRSDEQVDHIDGDKTNDVIENLQVLSSEQNLRKQFEEKSSLRKMVQLKCPNPNCRKIFERPRKNTHLAKQGVFTACSRICAGYVRAKLGRGENFEREIRENVIDQFNHRIRGEELQIGKKKPRRKTRQEKRKTLASVRTVRFLRDRVEILEEQVLELRKLLGLQ